MSPINCHLGSVIFKERRLECAYRRKLLHSAEQDDAFGQ